MATFDDFDIGLRNERQLADLEAVAQAPQTPSESDPGTFVRKDTLTAKGDIFAATAAGVIARQAAGTNGQVVSYDNTTTTGLKPVALLAITPTSGWTAWTGTPDKTSHDTATATLTNVTEGLKAVIDALITAGILTA